MSASPEWKPVKWRPIITSPFVGLRPYREDDHPYFFGRRREQLIVAANLIAWRITVLTGASGAGKTSLLRAGVIPLLMSADSPFGQPDGSVVYVNRWQQDPSRSIVQAISTTVACRNGPDVVESWNANDLKSVLATAAKLAGGELLMIFDQFEEFFLYHRDDEALVATISGLMTHDVLPVNFLISIRKDHLGELGAFRPRLANILVNTIQLAAVSPEAAALIVKDIIASYNQRSTHPVHVEPDLVETIIDKLGSQRLAIGSHVSQTGRVDLPLLQIVMEQIWSRGQLLGSHHLGNRDLYIAGDTTAILGSYFNSALDTLPNTSRNILAAIAPFLVEPSGAKRAQTVKALAEIADVPEQQLRLVIDTLVSRRLLQEVSGPSGEWFVELQHDLIGPALLKLRGQSEGGLLWRPRGKADRKIIVMMLITLASILLAAWALWQK